MTNSDQRRGLAFLIALCVLLLFLSGCFKVSPAAEAQRPVGGNGGEGVLAADAQEPAGSTASLPPAAARTDAPAKVELFVDGSRSMMGFVDWKKGYPATYTELIPKLLNVAEQTADKDVLIHRFDLNIAQSNWKVDKQTFLQHYATKAFYNYTELDTVPAAYRENPNYINHDATKRIPGWYEQQKLLEDENSLIHKAIDMGDGLDNPYQLATDRFSDNDTLNIMVTDLYALQMSDADIQFDKLKDTFIQPGKAVGIYAIDCEFGGLLPNPDGSASYKTWGSPTSDSYSGYQDASYWAKKEDGSSYRVYRIDTLAHTMEQRMELIQQNDAKTRPLYILFAGDRDVVISSMDIFGAAIAGLSDKQAREFFSPDCTDMADLGELADITWQGHIERDSDTYVVLKDKEGNPPGITVSVPYTRNPLLDSRDEQNEGFELSYTLYRDGGKIDEPLVPITLTYNESKLWASCDLSGLKNGDYTLTIRYLVDPEKKAFQALDSWDWPIAKRELYALWNAEDDEWDMASYNKTMGLKKLLDLLQDAVNSAAQTVTIGQAEIAISIKQQQ